MKLKCLIIDDEPLAHEVIEEHIKKLDLLEVVANCYSGIEAINYLNKKDVDVLFLDINMPDMSGLEMLGNLSTPPLTILTTAYSEFALKGYEYGIVDYLMKPIAFSRFLKATNRLLEYFYNKDQTPNIEDDNTNGFIEINDGYLKKKLPYTEIEYIQAYGNYVKIFTKDKMYLLLSTMKSFEKILPQSIFLRIHKSYIINLAKIVKASKRIIVINENELPIGNSYLREVRSKI